MSKNVTLTIDGRQITVQEGSTILEAARRLGIDIPVLCHNDALRPFTSCFLCVVEIEGRTNPAPACSSMALDGMIVHTRSENIISTRRMCLELLLSDHCGDCIAPCALTCPAGCNVQQFIRDIAEGRADKAIRTLKENLPFPGSLGRICPRPCETKCRRIRVEEPLTIGWLHRYAADADADVYRPSPGKNTGKRVAVIGAGPAGMSCAYFLRREGHSVTVFEAEEKAGGMLAWGIPAFRLPREELAKEIKAIVDMGVDMQFGRMFGRDFSISDLRDAGFDAVFIAIGAQLSSPLRTDGDELPGVIGGIEMLNRSAHGENVPVGKKVIVVGGGNTAIDAARTARRLGAETALLYRRTRAEMPALPAEVSEAEREGVEFKFLAAPLKIRERGGRLAVRCQRMKLGEPDESGRRRPVPVQGDTFELVVDTVISAIGQMIDWNVLKKEGVQLDEHERMIAVNPNTLQTSAPDVFAGGDAVAGEDRRIAVWAVGSGRLAAVSIDQYLNGRAVTGIPPEFNCSMGVDPDDVSASRFEGVEPVPRAAMPEIEPEARIDNFNEVELGFTPEIAGTEAARCLKCGCDAAEDCKLRKYALEYGADPNRLRGAMRDYSEDDSSGLVVIEQGKCINCGICTRLGSDADDGVFGFVNRGFSTRVRAYFEPPVSKEKAELAAECAEACPTGAIVRKRDPSCD